MLDREEEKFRDLHIARRQQSERRKSTTRERRKLEAEKDTRNADVKRRRTSKNFQRDQVGRWRGGERGGGGRGGGSGFDSRWSLVRLFHPTSKARNFIAHKRAGGAAIISGAKFPGIDAAPGRDPNSPVPRPGSAAPRDSELSFSITVDFPCYNSLHVPTQCSSYIFKITTLFLRAALLCLFGCALPRERTPSSPVLCQPSSFINDFIPSYPPSVPPLSLPFVGFNQAPSTCSLAPQLGTSRRSCWGNWKDSDTSIIKTRIKSNPKNGFLLPSHCNFTLIVWFLRQKYWIKILSTKCARWTSVSSWQKWNSAI